MLGYDNDHADEEDPFVPRKRPAAAAAGGGNYANEDDIPVAQVIAVTEAPPPSQQQQQQQQASRGWRARCCPWASSSSSPSASESAGGVDDPVENIAKSLRLGFVRKVFGILAVQLAVTFGIICLFVFSPEVNTYVRSRNGSWLYWTSIFVFIASLLALACARNLARTVPYNYVALGVVTLSMSVMLGVVSSFYNSNAVMIAFAMAVGITIALSLFACQTRVDVTGWGFYLFAALIVLIFFGIFAAIFYNQVVTVVWCSLALLLFSFYVVYDVQLMLGKHKFSIGLDEYVFAALNLYLDVANIFLILLSLGGGR